MSGDETDRQEFAKELQTLCRGRGVEGSDFHDRLGPLIRVAARVPEAGSRHEQRKIVIAWLENAIDSLPDGLALPARVAFGLHPPADDKFLKGRQFWLAGDLERDVRTARRRMEEALDRIAELAVEEPARGPADAPPERAPTEWSNRSIRTLVLLGGPVPELIEERTIEGPAMALTLDVSLAPTADGTRPEVVAEVLFGGALAAQERLSPSHLRIFVELPAPIPAGETHELVLRYRVPTGSFAPHYALTPHRSCDEFALRVAFPVPAPRVWELAGVTTRSLDDPPDGLKSVELDRFGGVEVRFSALRPGLGYGLRWTNAPGG